MVRLDEQHDQVGAQREIGCLTGRNAYAALPLRVVHADAIRIEQIDALAIDIDKRHLNAGLGQPGREQAAHGTGADNDDLFHGMSPAVLRQIE
jgi:hypothetical protein